MDKKTFNRFREIVYDLVGISLGPNKEALVTSRVSKRMRALGIHEYKEYLDYVEADKSGEEIIHMIDAISTNVTSFFRESQHFDFLSKIMKEWLDNGQKRFRLWSAASSSGEEPYSIAITLKEIIQPYNNIDAKILATDISTRVLKKCMVGEYGEERVKTVLPQLRGKYFEKVKTDGKNIYEVKDALKMMIMFRRLNLSTPPFPMKGPLDVVFCRNVMIYFDNIVRKNLLSEIYRILKPGGYLMVGHAESLTGMMMKNLKVVAPSVYIKT